jgi:serine/threonine protein kinase
LEQGLQDLKIDITVYEHSLIEEEMNQAFQKAIDEEDIESAESFCNQLDSWKSQRPDIRVALTLDELKTKMNNILAVSTEKIKEAMTNRRFDVAKLLKQNKAELEEMIKQYTNQPTVPNPISLIARKGAKNVAESMSTSISQSHLLASYEKAASSVPLARWQDIEKGDVVYSGSMSTVYTAKWRDTDIALKLVRGGNHMEGTKMNGLLAEVDLLQQLRHPNIVSLMAVCQDIPAGGEGILGILTEYCARGSLYHLLHEVHGLRQAQLIEKLRLALDVASGMSFLHGSRIVHRDLKSGNVLIDSTGRAKIADFGLSKLVDLTMTHVTGVTGSVAWAAPEVLQEEAYRDSADVYSFGVILWELLMNEIPWQNKTHVQVITAILVKRQTLISSVMRTQFPSAIFSLLEECLQSGPELRPGFHSIKERLEEYIEGNVEMMNPIPECLQCPIGYNLMVDPVVCADGHSYDRAAIEEWFRFHNTSPLTNQPLPNKHLIPNHTLRKMIDEFNQKKKG